MARITCYDGVGCIGGNKILLEDGDAKLWLDFGLDFGRMGTFYEEYLKPKNCAGLYEPVQMGLLPPIRDLYRSDLVCSLADPWSGIDTQTIGKVDGILLSHAHLDHIGSLHYVRDDIPVYSSAMTLVISKATQDTGAGTPDDYCYTAAYEPTDNGALTTGRNYKNNPSRSRPCFFVDEAVTDGLSKFWDFTPSSLSKYGRPHQPSKIGASSACGGLGIRRFPVDHSVYGACAWAVETDGGWVVYTGDLRCNGGRSDLTWKFAEEASKLKPSVLIMEGTRIESEDTKTENDICGRALDEVKKAKGLVIADFGPRNIERLVSFLEVARQTGRKLILLPKDAYLLEKMALVTGDGSVPSLDDKSILIYCKYEVSTLNWGKLIREKYHGKLVQPWQLAKNQDKAICCFSFFDVNELAYIRPAPGSIWIYSSCEPFSEEMKIDFERLNAWLRQFGVALLGGAKNEEKSPFHVSGHACRSDLLKLVDMIGPQKLIPVHCEKPALYQEALKGECEVILPERGVPISL
jgi:ribonuclease J